MHPAATFDIKCRTATLPAKVVLATCNITRKPINE
jgi:hypothetical protein